MLETRPLLYFSSIPKIGDRFTATINNHELTLEVNLVVIKSDVHGYMVVADVDNEFNFYTISWRTKHAQGISQT